MTLLLDHSLVESGVLDLDLGLERAGWECRWQSEIDVFCLGVLEHHWPDVKRYGDVKEIDWAGVEPVDLIAGGAPCQDFSTMGEQRGIYGSRWLWPWMREAVRVLRPRYVLLENVAALKADRAAFGSILGDLHQLGFDAEWSIVSACSVGAPHLRRRLFVLAHTRSERRQQEPGGSPGHEGPDVANSSLQDNLSIGHAAAEGRANQWASEPGVGRLASRLPRKLVIAANRGIGNSVVPQVAEWVARNKLPRPQEG